MTATAVAGEHGDHPDDLGVLLGLAIDDAYTELTTTGKARLLWAGDWTNPNPTDHPVTPTRPTWRATS
jgi:hypothetical protein